MSFPSLEYFTVLAHERQFTFAAQYGKTVFCFRLTELI